MLPIEFLLFPNDYTDKQNLKKAISEYATAEISYIDYANTITDVSKTLIDILSFVLSVFCAISLTICIIMMGILSYISVIERSKDLAILRVLGYTKRHLKKEFMSYKRDFCFIFAVIYHFIECNLRRKPPH